MRFDIDITGVGDATSFNDDDDDERCELATDDAWRHDALVDDAVEHQCRCRSDRRRFAIGRRDAQCTIKDFVCCLPNACVCSHLKEQIRSKVH